jgi:hypothetical protein
VYVKADKALLSIASDIVHNEPAVGTNEEKVQSQETKRVRE